MIAIIDAFLDRITMYKLLRYYLAGLLIVALCMSAIGWLAFNPLALVVTTLLALAACWTLNQVLAYIFHAPISTDSSIITAFILALIISPGLDKMTILFVLAASGLAMASKYIITINRKHIFNPAAVAVALTALGPKQAASWWVGSAVMLPFVLAGGILLVRKLRRWTMVGSFLIATITITAVLTWLNHQNIVASLHDLVLSSAVFFLGFVMLTEPATSPPTSGKQGIYGALVGVLMAPQVHLFNFYTSPEIALLAGNIFSYIVSPKTKLFPILKEKINIAARTVEFVFDPGKRFAYQPGQYMELTLPHVHADNRGDRRYFTLSSSPTEQELRVAVKFYDHGSSYKKALRNMDAHTPIVAAQLAGSFVLLRNQSQKLAFIAGGIGITPFRSMTKYMLDRDEQRDVVLLYGAQSLQDIAYADMFETARQKLGMKTVYALSGGHSDLAHAYAGQVDEALIRQEIPDYMERIFYISGTHVMVTSIKQTLRHFGVPRRNIKTDFFPGYV